MQKFRVICHGLRLRASGFTLVELMVTLAVLAVLAVMAAPSIQQFVAKSEMNGLQSDFTAALSRARQLAAARNTCVSVCQLASGTASSCNLSNSEDGLWEQGWIIFENPTCTSPSSSASYDVTSTSAVGLGIRLIQVREPRNARYTLRDAGSEAKNLLTYNNMGQLRHQNATFALRDTQNLASLNGRNIVLSAEGRVMVQASDYVEQADTDAGATAAGGTGSTSGSSGSTTEGQP